LCGQGEMNVEIISYTLKLTLKCPDFIHPLHGVNILPKKDWHKYIEEAEYIADTSVIVNFKCSIFYFWGYTVRHQQDERSDSGSKQTTSTWSKLTKRGCKV